MKENDFFESLVNKVNEGALPFNEKDWQLMQEKLDEERDRNIIPFLPIRMCYLSAGLAAAVMIGIGLFYKLENPSEPKPQTPTGYVKREIHLPIKDEAEHRIILTGKSASKKNIAAVTKNNKVRKGNSVVKDVKPDTIIAIADSSYFSDIRMVEKEPNEEPIEIVADDEKKEEPIIIRDRETLPVWNEVHFAGNRSVFYAGGGVNYGAQAMGYAIKLGLEKPFTSRFSVHTALAVNTNDRNVTVSEIDKIVPTNIITTSGNYTSFDTFYKQSHRDFAQAFAQALVGVDYKLYKTGKLGLSADAVRLLKSRQQLDYFNERLITDKISPLWNVGLRIQYTQQITRHFDIGTLYRQDVSGKINKTWENNFLQLMLIYKVGNRKD